MTGTEVTPERLRDTSRTIKSIVTEMQATLDEATSVVNNTANSWQMTAADELRSRYTHLTSKFSDFYEAINTYAQFLETSATAYETLDAQTTAKAQEYLNDNYNA